MPKLQFLSGAILVSLCAIPSQVHGQDWPAWGGSDPGRNMRSTSPVPAATNFNPGKFKPGSDELETGSAKNIRWVARLGSESYGNPVVAGGKVFVGTNNEHPRDSRRQGDYSILLCLDEKTGAFLWQLAVPKLAAGKHCDWENLGILCSPAVEKDRLYLVSTRCEVLCLTTDGLGKGNIGPFTNEAQYIAGPGKPPAPVDARDADIIWRFDMIHELGVFPHNAANCSVLVLGDVVYVCTSNGQDWSHNNVPYPFAPSLIALDKKTGRLLGCDDAGIGPRIFHGQWSSPAAGLVAGRWLVFFGGGDGFLYAFDAKPVGAGENGRLQNVWKADANPPEYRFRDGQPVKYGEAEGPSEINATPVFYRNRVYTAIGQDPENGEGSGRLACFNAAGSGDISRTGLVWEFKEIKRSLSTPAIDTASGLLFTADYSGYVYCLEAETGRLCWTHDMKAHVWGSPLVADGKVFIADEDGDFIVFAAAAEKKILHETSFPAPIHSTAVAANGVLYVATATHLYAIAPAP